MVIADKKLKIVHSNQSFIDLLGNDALEINDIIPGLVGADLKSLLPYNIYNQFSYVLQNGEDVMNRDLTYKEVLLNISVFTIKKGSVVGAILRDMMQLFVFFQNIFYTIRRNTSINLLTNHYHWC